MYVDYTTCLVCLWQWIYKDRQDVLIDSMLVCNVKVTIAQQATVVTTYMLYAMCVHVL